MGDSVISLDASALESILNNTKWWFAALVFAGFVVWRVFAYKDKLAAINAEKSRNESKEKRAERYSTALDNLSKSMAEMKTKIDNISKKASAMLSFSESLVLINAFFLNFTRYACDTVSQSIKENNYARYREHIKVRVKTDLGDSFSDIRSELSNVKCLGVDINYFFINVINEPSESETTRIGRHERFLLIDRIWDKIEQFYIPSGGLNEEECTGEQKVRLEAAVISIKNEVNDYVTEVTNSIKDRYMRDITGRHRAVERP